MSANQVNWLLENDIFDEGLDSLKAAIKSQGMSYQETSYYDFLVKEYNSNATYWYYPAESCVIFYGSINLCKLVLTREAWIPGTFCTWKNYLCTHYYPRLGNELLNANYIMLPLGEIDRRASFLLDTLEEDGCIFVRPNRGDKPWVGQILDYHDWSHGLEQISYNNYPTELAVVCTPQNIVREWRLFVCDQQIIAYTEYKPLRARSLPQEVRDYAHKIIALLEEPNPVWCLDLGLLFSGELKVLEIGSFSVAGLYACNPNPIVEAVSRKALEAWEEIYE